MGYNTETIFLKEKYAEPQFTEPDEGQVLRAILSVTEAISQSDPNNTFGLYSSNSWENQGNDLPSDPILRSGRPVFFPWRWRNRGMDELILVHARLDNGQQGGNNAAAYTPRLALTFYNFASSSITGAARNRPEQDVRQFLIDRRWFGSDSNPPPSHNATWIESTKNVTLQRNFMVIFIAMALALNMQIKNVLPDLTKRPKKDKEYASAVIVDASNGIATPTHILAALVKLKIVDDAFVRNWGQGLFAQTVNLSGAAFDAHYTTVRASIPPPAGENDGDPLDERSQTSQEGERTELPDPLPDTSKDKPQETQDRTQDDRQDGLPTGKQNGQGNAQQNGQENGHQDGQQNGQQDAQTNLDGRWQQTRCITCNVANHCPGSSGTSQSCSHCSHNEHCCLKCPVVSHCIPVLREMQSGHLYNWSIHNFRQEFQHTKRSLQSRTDQNGRPDRPLDDLFCIRMGMHLQESDVIRAIEAVTEAISLTKISKKFTLFSLNQWQNSRHDVKAVENQNPFPFDVVRRREDIVLPVVINKHQLRVLKEGKSNPNTVLKEFNAAEGHIVLAHVKYEKAAKDFSVDIYDSSLAFLRNIRHEAERMIRKFLRDTRWWWIDDQAHPLPQGRFNWREDTAAQRDSTSCGIHTILNGWAVAFDLPLNPSPNLDRLHRAIEVMMHACYGAVDCETIVQFLHFIRWVHPKNPIRGHTFKKTCAFPGLRELDDHHTGMWYMQEAGCVWGGIPKPYGSDLGCIKCSKSNHCRLQSNHRSDGNGSKRVRSKRFSGVHFLQSAMRQGKKRQLGGKVDSARRRKKQRT